MTYSLDLSIGKKDNTQWGSHVCGRINTLENRVKLLETEN